MTRKTPVQFLSGSVVLLQHRNVEEKGALTHTHTRTHTDMQTHIHSYVDTHATDTNKYITY